MNPFRKLQKVFRFCWRVLRTFVPLRNNPYPCLLVGLFITNCHSASVPWLPYDPNRCVPYQTDNSICRTAWDWFVTATNEVSCYYQNGGPPQGCESGTWSLNLLQCWTLATGSGVKIAILDIDAIHGRRVKELCQKVCGADVQLAPIARYYPNVVAAAIIAIVDAGAQVIAMPFGIVNGSPSDPAVLSALEHGNTHNVLFVAAAPYDGRNVDANPDWPNLPHLMQVNHGRMDGTLNLGYTSTGTNLLCFPGRNLVAQGVYYGGNSDACGVASGFVALLIDKHPTLSLAQIVNVLRATSDESWHRINAVRALSWNPAPIIPHPPRMFPWSPTNNE